MTVHYSYHFHAISSMLCPLTVSVQMGKTPTLNLYSNINMLVTKGRLTCVRSVLIVAGMRSGWNIQRLISSDLLSPARSYFSKVPRPARTGRPAGDWGPKHRYLWKNFHIQTLRASSPSFPSVFRSSPLERLPVPLVSEPYKQCLRRK